jgi:hypothetical protein
VPVCSVELGAFRIRSVKAKRARTDELQTILAPGRLDQAVHRASEQALFAFVDSLVKILLTCIAEPPSDADDQAVAQGKFRYDRFLKSVGAAMAGDSKAARSSY